MSQLRCAIYARYAFESREIGIYWADVRLVPGARIARDCHTFDFRLPPDVPKNERGRAPVLGL
jgi:hypothetical protein